jgi:hypothetical protein
LKEKNRFLNFYSFFYNSIQAEVECDCKVNPGDQWNDLCDFFLWAWAKDKVYWSKPGTQDELKQKSKTFMLLILFTS